MHQKADVKSEDDIPLDSVNPHVIKPGNHSLLFYNPAILTLLIVLATNDEMRRVENLTECPPFKPPETSSGDTIEKSGK